MTSELDGPIEIQATPRVAAADRDMPPPQDCPTCGATGTGQEYCGRCGTEIATGVTFDGEYRHEKTAKQAMRVILAPVFEYFEHAPGLPRPGRLVEHIREHRFTGIDVTGLWVAASVLAALSGAFFPNGIKRIDIPILVEAVEAGVVMGMTIAIYAPLHLFLRGRGRSATFREFALMTLATAGLLYPWISLGQGIALRLGIKLQAFSQWPLMVSALFYARAYIALYRRKAGAIVALMALYFAVILATAIAAMLLIDMVRDRWAPAQPAKPAAAARAKAH